MKALSINIIFLFLCSSAINAQLKIDCDKDGNIKTISRFGSTVIKTDNCTLITGVTVKLKKIEYESDELTIKGFVFEEKKGKRFFVIVKGEELKSIPLAYRNKLYTFLEKNAWFSIAYNACGSEGPNYLVSIRRTKNESDKESSGYYYYPTVHLFFGGYFYPYYFPYYNYYPYYSYPYYYRNHVRRGYRHGWHYHGH